MFSFVWLCYVMTSKARGFGGYCVCLNSRGARLAEWSKAPGIMSINPPVHQVCAGSNPAPGNFFCRISGCGYAYFVCSKF